MIVHKLDFTIKVIKYKLLFTVLHSQQESGQQQFYLFIL